MMEHVQVNDERCTDCKLGTACRWHQEAIAHRDAWIASEIGRGWATRVWHELDVRRPWPTFDGRCAATATRLVSWLTHDDDLARRRELAELCSWRAGLRWELQQCGLRDRPYRPSSTRGVEYALPGYEHVVIRFAPSSRAGGIAQRRANTVLVESKIGARAERCRDCKPAALCKGHVESQRRWDAKMAAAIGVGWACYLWALTDYRGAWPSFDDRCAAIARHLVSWLAHRNDEGRCVELATICSWRASIRWQALQTSARARSSEPKSDERGEHVEYAIPGSSAVIRFRPPEHDRAVSLARAALEQRRVRGGRFREAQGMRPNLENAADDGAWSAPSVARLLRGRRE